MPKLSLGTRVGKLPKDILWDLPVWIRTMLLSLAMMCVPLGLGADCCGGGGGGDCGEKKTLVHWRFEGHGWGKVTVAGYYTDDMTTPLVEQSLVVKPGDCVDGEFCADDGRIIEWIITAHTDQDGSNPSTGTNANLLVTWGCSGMFKLSSYDKWKLESGGSGQPESTGQMSTGETNGCGCSDEFGYGLALNGSVHMEWDMGQRFGPFYGMDVQANNMVLPKMLLSMNLPPADGNCSPALLRIPQPDRVHTVIMSGVTRQNPPSINDIPLSYYAPDGPGFWVNRDFQVNRFKRLHADEFSDVTVGSDTASANPIVEWVRDGAIFEVRTGTGLVMFTQINPKKFVMTFYLNNSMDFDAPHAPNQPYPFKPGIARPNFVWTVECLPSGQAMRVTKSPGPQEEITTWTYFDGAWSMTTADNRTEWKKVEPLGSGRRRTIKTLDDGGNTLNETVNEFDEFNRLTKTVEGVGADAVTTNYVNPAGQQQQVEALWRSDGYFEKYLYSGPKDVLPYTKTVIRPWLDVSYAAATVGNARVTETRTEAYEGGSLVTTTEKIEGNVVGKTTAWTRTRIEGHADFGPQPVTTITTRSYARDASGALVAGNENKRQSYAGGASDRLRGRPIEEISANGTKNTWHYSNGFFEVPSPIAPSTGGHFTTLAGALFLEIRERRDVAPAGSEIPGRTTENRQYLDLVVDGALVLEESGVYPVGGGGAYVPVKRTFHTYDPARHLTDTVVTPADGSNPRATYHAVYVGDHMTSETDETGVTTTYSNYNLSGNARTVTRGVLAGLPALETIRVFDTVGRITSETQRVPGGTALQTRSSLFDTRGRTTSETASGLTTSFTYPAGSETRTTPGSGAVTTTYYKDGQVKQVSGPGVVTTNYTYNIVNGLMQETVTRGAGNETVVSLAERNGGGQTLREKIAAPGNAWRIFQYDAAGRLGSEWIDGTQTRALGYDATGGMSETVFATPDPARTFATTEAIVTEGTAIWHERRASDGARSREKLNAGALLSLTEQRAANGRTVMTSTSVNRGDAEVTTETADSAVGNHAITVSRGGAVVSSQTPEKPLGVTYSYDALGRAETVTDTATGTATMMTYDPVTGQVASQTTTAAGGGGSTNTVNTYYTAAETAAGQMPGRLKQRNVDGVVTTYRYTARGEVAEVNGATYPLRYEYDAAGRLWKLHTYQTEPGANLNETGSVTTWLYVPGTALLWKKLDAAGAGAVYGYDALGRLQTRTWARNVGGQALTTTYTYNLAGDMKHLDYSDSTPDVTLGYDARGRLASRTDGAGTTALSYYGETGQVADEIGSDGSRLHREVDGAGRETGYYLWDRFRFATWGGWGYAAATGKVDGAMTEAGWVSYADTEAANLTKHETVLTGTGVKTVSQRNGLGRLQALATLVGAATPTPLAGRRYEYTAEGRVGKVSEGSTTNGGAAWTDTGRWEYAYDDEGRGQVKTGQKFAGATGTQNYPGMKRGYRYDAIGNRTRLDVNSLENDWVANGLNQIVSRSVEGKQYIVGEANPLATLTVQAEGDQLYSSAGPSPKVDLTRQPGNWFSAKINTENDALAKNLKVTVTEQVGTATAREAIGHVFVPGSREQFSYDADGNLTRDGHWTYVWDAENRLVAMETRQDITVAGPDPVPVLRLTFRYDALSRRVGKKVERKLDAAWQSEYELWFAYEGWNLLAEWKAEPVDLELARTYQWGTDLSGTRQGAGGVGGLLLINKHSANGTVQSYYPCYGDNGNIEALLDVSDPVAGVTVAASYEYGPFGEALRATGVMASANPFRWSTKYTDNETGIIYYGYRFYDPHIGRWINRDPIGERGGRNLYAFVRNRVTRTIDLLGLDEKTFWERFGDKARSLGLNPIPPKKNGGANKDGNKSFVGTPCVKTAFQPSKMEYLPWKYERNKDDSSFGRLVVKIETIKVTCTPGNTGKLNCIMSFDAFAYINSTRHRNKDGSPVVEDSDIYGHEQRHMQNVLQAAFSLAESLSKSGNTDASSIEEEYKKRLNKIFTDEATHDKDVTGNPNTPNPHEPVSPKNPPDGDWNDNQLPQTDEF